MATLFGYLDVDEMLDTISAKQFSEWMDYFSIEPFGYEIENYRAGVIASAIYNVNRQSKGDKVFEPKDFFQFEKKKPPKQTWEEQYELAKTLCSLYNQKGE